MRWNRLLVAFAVLAVAGGCSSASTKYTKYMNSWLTEDEDDLVREWGPPVRTYELSNGNKIFLYAENSTLSVPGYTTPIQSSTSTVYSGGTAHSSTTFTGGQSYGGYTVSQQCESQFELRKFEEKYVVVNWRWRGNKCRVSRATLQEREEVVTQRCKKPLLRLTEEEKNEICSDEISQERRLELTKKAMAIEDK